MAGDGIQKGDSDRARRDADTTAGSLPSAPEKAEPKSVEEAIRAGDWAAVARIRAATIAQLERNSHEDADGDGRIGDNRADTFENGGSGYLDANGCDPDGYKYYANFGYDSHGNYHDSYGGVLDTKTQVYTAEDGGQSDLKHGVSTQKGFIYNNVTHQAMAYDENENKYYIVNWDPKTKKSSYAEKDENGEPIGHTEAEAKAWQADAIKTNPAQSDQQGRQSETDMVNTDVYRQAKVTGANSQDEQPRNGETSKQRNQPRTATAAEGKVNPGLYAQQQTTDARLGTAELFGARFQQKQANAQRALAQAATRQEYRTPELNAGNSTRFGPSYDTDNKPVKGPVTYKGGVVDENGGYKDKDGGYSDKLGGYRAPDGSYTDAVGNYVDKNGNLWLADNKTGKPDFMKQDGIDYAGVLQTRAEHGYLPGAWRETHPSFKNGKSQKLEDAISGVYQAWDKRNEAATFDNRAYAGQGKMLGNFVDKQGNLWLQGSVHPVAKQDGVDYIDLLKKAEQGKIDEWKKTGNLTADEINAIKEQVNVIRESGLSDLGLQQKISELTEISEAAKKGVRYKAPKNSGHARSASPKSKFAPKDKTAAADTDDDGEPAAKTVKAAVEKDASPVATASSFVAVNTVEPAPSVETKTLPAAKREQPKVQRVPT